MIKSITDILQESAEMDKDILEIMDESVPAFEYTTTGLDANYLEGENFIAEAYADMMTYKAEANQILIESMGLMNESAVVEMRHMIDETLTSKAASIGFKVAQFFRALIKKIRVAILSGQLKTISKMLPTLESSGADLTKAGANCAMAEKISDLAVKCILNNHDEVTSESLAKDFDEVVAKINELKVEDYSNIQPKDIGKTLNRQINLAKTMITALEKWATEAVNASSAEEAANARKVSSSMNKIVTAYLKAVSASLKAIKSAAPKKTKGDNKAAPAEA